jgi:hypothetical protein
VKREDKKKKDAKNTSVSGELIHIYKIKMKWFLCWSTVALRHRRMELKLHTSAAFIPEKCRHGGINRNSATTKIGSKLNMCRL